MKRSEDSGRHARSGRSVRGFFLGAVAALAVAVLPAKGASFLGDHDPDPIGGERLTIEAEAFRSHERRGMHRWQLVTAPDGTAVAAQPEQDSTIPPSEISRSSPQLTFRIDIPEPGTRYLWIRGYAEDSGSNSVYVALGDGDALPVTLDSYRTWSWTNLTMDGAPATVEVTAPGEQILRVWMREDGFVLDKIVLAAHPWDHPLDDSHEISDTPQVLWSADHESGDLSAWSDTDLDIHCGGAFNSGGGRALVTRENAHSGRFAAKLVIGDVDGDQGARLFRGRCESFDHPALYYSAWFYFPERFDLVDGWWNVMQWKSERSGAEHSDPVWVLDVRNRDDGDMFFVLRQKDGEVFQQTSADIPVARWFHVEAFYRSAGDDTGELVVWQDGHRIFRVDGVRTRYPDGDTRWSVNNYTSGISPDPAVLYVDDAMISLDRVGPEAVPPTR